MHVTNHSYILLLYASQNTKNKFWYTAVPYRYWALYSKNRVMTSEGHVDTIRTLLPHKIQLLLNMLVSDLRVYICFKE